MEQPVRLRTVGFLGNQRALVQLSFGVPFRWGTILLLDFSICGVIDATQGNATEGLGVGGIDI